MNSMTMFQSFDDFRICAMTFNYYQEPLILRSVSNISSWLSCNQSLIQSIECCSGQGYSCTTPPLGAHNDAYPASVGFFQLHREQSASRSSSSSPSCSLSSSLPPPLASSSLSPSPLQLPTTPAAWRYPLQLGATVHHLPVGAVAVHRHPLGGSDIVVFDVHRLPLVVRAAAVAAHHHPLALGVVAAALHCHPLAHVASAAVGADSSWQRTCQCGTWDRL